MDADRRHIFPKSRKGVLPSALFAVLLSSCMVVQTFGAVTADGEYDRQPAQETENSWDAAAGTGGLGESTPQADGIGDSVIQGDGTGDGIIQGNGTGDGVIQGNGTGDSMPQSDGLGDSVLQEDSVGQAGISADSAPEAGGPAESTFQDNAASDSTDTAAAMKETAAEVKEQTDTQSADINVPVLMDVAYGYQNTAKSGRFLPIEVNLDNRTDGGFTGTLCVRALEPAFQNYSGSQPQYDAYQYEYPVSMEAGGKLSRKLSISLANRVDQMYLVLLDSNRKEISRKRLKMNLTQDTAELFIGVLSDTPDKLLCFNNVGINYSTLRTRTVNLTAAALPSSALGLDQLDVLLITNFDTGTLSEDQIGAVWEWVHKGGVLLFGTGGRGGDSLRAFEKELLEYPVPKSVVYKVNMGAQYAVDNPESATFQLQCTEAELKGGSELLSSGELSVLSGAAEGNGLAAVAIYDFTEIEEFCLENPSYIDEFFTTLLGEDRINSLAGAMGGTNSGAFWSIQGLINTGNINRLPRVELYVTLAVAYVVLAGPGLYFFLKQRELRRLYQPAVAILSICCTGMVLLMGVTTRFKGPFFTYAAIRSAEGSSVSETSFVNMRAPYNKDYSVELNPDYTLYPVTGAPYYSGVPMAKFTGQEEPSITIRYDEDATRISAQNEGAFKPRFFQLERSQENTQGEGFTGDISAFDGKITGSLTNHYNQAVENVAVLLYNQMVLIGTVEPGQTVELDNLEVVYGTTNFDYAMAAQITGASAFKRKVDVKDKAYVEAMERTNLLSFYVGNYLSGFHSQAQVVGFGRDKEETQFLNRPDYETYGCTLLTTALDVNYEQNGMVYRSAMQKQPNVLAGEYYASNNTIYGTAPVILEYYLGNEVEVEKLDIHQLNDEVVESLRYYYTVPFSGNMYFYNYNTGNYDLMDSGILEYKKDVLEPYLSPGNTLTIKYVYNAAGDYTWNIMLPVLTVTGRSK